MSLTEVASHITGTTLGLFNDHIMSLTEVASHITGTTLGLFNDHIMSLSEMLLLTLPVRH